MEVIVSKMYKLEGEGKIKAFVDLTFGGVLQVKGFKIVDGVNGLFLSYPSTKSKKDEKYYNSVYVIDEVMREEMNALAISAYQGKEKQEEPEL